ncbi:putative insulin receptor binding protein [Trypoxylus dichotomus]
MEDEKSVYSGYLLLPPTGKLVIKKSWQQKYCVLYKSSKSGIERLEIYDDLSASRNSPYKIITLENCIKITQKAPTLFTIITKTAAHDFSTQSEQALKQWTNALQSVAFRDDVSKVTIVEDNDLYCSSGEGVFSVKLHTSDASKRCGLEPINYTLVLTSTALQLRSSTDNKLLCTWPYCFIRRYGHKEGKFTFEAGRKCETGEGTFLLEHSNQQEIFRCVASKMKSMKKLLKGESSPALLDCGDNQLHAALIMEPRSRSPLPPSPTSSTSLQDMEVTKTSILTDLWEKRSNPLMKSSRSETEFFTLKKPEDTDTLNGKKRIPQKPPRKTVNKVDNFDKDYEVFKKYDKIEYRNNAWQELGLDEINHTENPNPSDDEDDAVYASWGRPKEPTPEPEIPKAPKVITEPPLNEISYDKLNFFGSAIKLSGNKSGYKQVTPAPIVPHQPSPPSFNEYDEVNIIMESARLADDSHLGYALVRKSPKENPVDHQFHNNDPYAIISKPKRV